MNNLIDAVTDAKVTILETEAALVAAENFTGNERIKQLGVAHDFAARSVNKTHVVALMIENELRSKRQEKEVRSQKSGLCVR